MVRAMNHVVGGRYHAVRAVNHVAGGRYHAVSAVNHVAGGTYCGPMGGNGGSSPCREAEVRFFQAGGGIFSELEIIVRRFIINAFR